MYHKYLIRLEEFCCNLKSYLTNRHFRIPNKIVIPKFADNTAISPVSGSINENNINLQQFQVYPRVIVFYILEMKIVAEQTKKKTAQKREEDVDKVTPLLIHMGTYESQTYTKLCKLFNLFN